MNRLRGVSPGGVAYDYDPFGRRSKKTVGASSTYVLWDGDRLLAEYDGSGTRTARYAYAGGFAPLQVTLGSTVYDVHTDHLDTPRMLTNSVGTVVWRANYEAFGKAAVDEDPDGNSQSVTFNVRFPGQYYDAETGLHDNLHRYYDPTLGRYISADPLGQFGLGRNNDGVFAYLGVFPELVATDALHGGNGNVYSYALNRPLTLVDALGLYSCSYSISKHSMNCTANDPSNPDFSSDEAVSGRNTEACPDCQNNPERTDKSYAGPIPKGEYEVGPIVPGTRHTRGLTPLTDIGSRFGFQTHGCGDSAACSKGCIGFTTNAARDAFNEAMAAEEGNNSLTVVP